MHTRLLMCGYSHHHEPFVTGAEEGLNSYLFRWQTEGEAEALIDGRMRRVRTGDLLLYRPNDAYRLLVGFGNSQQARERVSSSDYFLACRGHWIDEWWQRRQRPRRINIGIEERLLSIWRMLVQEKRRIGQENGELCDYLLRLLCLTVDRMIDERYSPQGPPFVARRIKAYIEENATSRIRIRDIAEAVRLSESRVSHLFKEHLGQTIVQYIHEVRLAAAEERIKYSTLSLEQIAESCGFGSYSYFFRIFRKKYGQSPADYRTSYLSMR